MNTEIFLSMGSLAIFKTCILGSRPRRTLPRILVFCILSVARKKCSSVYWRDLKLAIEVMTMLKSYGKDLRLIILKRKKFWISFREKEKFIISMAIKVPNKYFKALNQSFKSSLEVINYLDLYWHWWGDSLINIKASRYFKVKIFHFYYYKAKFSSFL